MTDETINDIDNGTAICFIGFPGAGKTTAAKAMAEIIGTPLFTSTGDIVRELAADHFDTDLDSLTGEEIGEFSTMKRENDSPLYVAREAVGRTEADWRWPEFPLVLEGVRDKEAATFYRDAFEQFIIVFVHAPFQERVSRLADRSRESDEEGYSIADLMHREERELDWGMDELPDESDYVVMNTGDVNQLEHKLAHIVMDLIDE